MVDRYTKAVLTIIAVCLAVLAGQNFVSVGKAQGPVGSGPLGLGILRRRQPHVIVDAWGAYVATLPIPVQVR